MAISKLFQFGMTLVIITALIGCQRKDTSSTSSPTPAAVGPRPNVICILVDALRADRLGVYGNPRQLTPTFDEIASEGFLFERALSQSPWTHPSVATLFSSYYPGVHRVISFGEAFMAVHSGKEKVAVFNDRFDTLAESLHRNGYATAGFVASPFVLKEFGFAQGFDHFDTSFAHNTTPGNVVNDAALAWLKQRDASKPFFLYLHYMDAHGPYAADPKYLDPLLDGVENQPDKRKLSPAEYEKLDYLRKFPKKYTNREQHHRLRVYREYWEARYEAGIREMDDHLKDFRAQLRALGLWQDAYIIILADHGEALCEHGLWDHGYSTYDTDLHVPLILRWPNNIPAGKRFPYTVRLMDLMPTLLEQFKIPAVQGIQGTSLTSQFTGPFTVPRDHAYAEGVKIGPEQKALYSGNWKLLVNMKTDEQLLFNIAQDPGEQKNLADQEQSMLQAMLSILAQQMQTNQQLSTNFKSKYKNLTPEQIQRLKSLGYIK